VGAAGLTRSRPRSFLERISGPSLEATLFVAASTDHTKELLLTLFIVFGAAKLAAELFERLGQPAVVGEILGGIAIGPHALGLVALSETTTALAEIGVILLLFMVGLEVPPAALFKVSGRALVVAVGVVVLPFVAGWGLMAAYGATTVKGVFMGAASVGITARVFAGMGLLSLETSQIVLARRSSTTSSACWSSAS
jgi:Kef-type K+ transport system membrane component KefB